MFLKKHNFGQILIYKTKDLMTVQQMLTILWSQHRQNLLILRMTFPESKIVGRNTPPPLHKQVC